MHVFIYTGGARCSSVVRAFAHGEPIALFLVPASDHDWCNKGRGMCHPVCGMMHIKEHLLLMERVAHVAEAVFLSGYLSGPLPYV